MRHLLLLAFMLMALVANPASAQVGSGAVDLRITHTQQENRNLCWAALVAQVISKYSAGLNVQQCDLVNLVNDSEGRFPGNCCLNMSHQSCDITANRKDIVTLLTNYGVNAEVVSIPTTQEEVYQYLNSGRALMIGIKTTATDNHIYLVCGISWENGVPMLLINDSYYASPSKIPFQQAQPQWIQAIAVG